MKRKLQKLVALLLSLLLIIQTMPTALAGKIVSGSVGGGTYYLVTFEMENGQGAPVAITQLVAANATLKTLPQAPVKEKHIFLGWFDGETQYDTSTPITKAVTLKPVFKAIEAYTVTITYLDDEGVKIAADVVRQYYSGETTVDIIPSPAFSGMVANISSITINAAELDGGKTHTVVYSPANASYTLAYAFEDEDGTFARDPQYDVTAQGIVDMQVTATPLLNTPAGFSHDSSRLETDIVKQDGSTVVTAYYMRKTNLLLFNSMKGDALVPITAKYGASVTLPEAQRKGYDFQGWYEDEALTRAADENYTMPVDSETVLYAAWGSTNVNYDVVFWLERPNLTRDGEELGKETLDTATDFIYGFTSQGQAEAGKKHTLDSKTVASVVPKSDASYLNTFFTFHSSEEVEIAGDGSSVLNVYFWRKVFKVTFTNYLLPKDPVNGATALVVDGREITTDTYVMTVKLDMNVEKLWPQDVVLKEGSKHFSLWSSYYHNGPQVAYSQAIHNVLKGKGMTLSASYHTAKDYVYRMYYLEVLDQENAVAGGDVEKFGDLYYKLDTRYSSEYQQDKTMTTSGGWPGTSNIVGFEQPNPNGKGTDMAKPIAILSNDGKQRENDLGQLEYELHYYAKRKQSTLSFSVMGGDSVPSISKIRYETPLAQYKPANYVEDETTRTNGGVNYTFRGWYYDEAYTNPVSWDVATMAGQNMILYAKWEAEDITLKIDLNYQGAEEQADRKVKAGTILSTIADLPQPVRDNYIFTGWYRDANGDTLYGAQEMLYTSSILYAGWRENLVPYTVYYLDKESLAPLRAAKTVPDKHIGDIITEDALAIPNMRPEDLSLTITLGSTDANEITFYYSPAEEQVAYTIHYGYYKGDQWVDFDDPHGPVEKETAAARVVENAVDVEGYYPLAMVQALQLSSDPGKNVFYFAYAPYNNIHYTFNHIYQDKANGQYDANASSTVVESGILPIGQTVETAIKNRDGEYIITRADAPYSDDILRYTASREDGETPVVINLYYRALESRTVTKEWKDNGYEGRPTKLDVTLTGSAGDSDAYVTRNAPLTDANQSSTWTYTFTDLPMYDEAGNRVQYTVAEEDITGSYPYEPPEVIGLTLVNTLMDGTGTLVKTGEGEEGDVAALTLSNDGGTYYFAYIGGKWTAVSALESQSSLGDSHSLKLPAGIYTLSETIYIMGENSYQADTFGKYQLQAEAAYEVLPGQVFEIAASNRLITAPYTVRYMNYANEEIAPAKAGAALPLGSVVAADAGLTGARAFEAPVPVEGYTFDKGEADSVIITGEAEGNEIIFLYRRNLTIQGANKTLVYNGQRQEVREARITSGTLFADHSFTTDAYGAAETVADSGGPVTVSESVILDERGESANYMYNITYAKGTVTMAPAILQVAAANEEREYNGQAQSLTGVVLKAGQLPQGFALDDSRVTASGIHTGEYPLDASLTRVLDGQGRDVTENFLLGTENGKLIITKRPVTFRAEEGNFPYTGSAHTVGYQAEGILPGHSQQASLQGNVRTAPGANLVRFDTDSGKTVILAGGENVTDNYRISYVTAFITVQPPVNTAYTIEYYYDVARDAKDENPTYELWAYDLVDDAKELDVITDIGDAAEQHLLEGYVHAATENLPMTLSQNSEDNVIRVYYDRVQGVEYRVEYYYGNVLDAEATQEYRGRYHDIITAYQHIPRAGFVLAREENLPLTLGLAKEDNVIRIYYRAVNYTNIITDAEIPLHGGMASLNVGDAVE